MNQNPFDPTNRHRDHLRRIITEIRPCDDREADHRAETLAWIDSNAPLWRTAKPATPPEHLVVYAVLIDPTTRSVLLVDHRLAQRWLPTGGHVEPGEDPAAAARRELREELSIDGASPYPATGGQPVFLTRTTTVGLSAGHTDVTLWFAFTGSIRDGLRADPGEFSQARWWRVNEIEHEPNVAFDPHLPRFLTKLERLRCTNRARKDSNLRPTA